MSEKFAFFCTYVNIIILSVTIGVNYNYCGEICVEGVTLLWNSEYYISNNNSL